jgi:hypothetical protein
MLRLELSYAGSSSMRFAPFKRLRVSFTGLTQPLNLNVVAFSGGLYGHNGCNLAAGAGPFVVELPFDHFSQPGGPIDFDSVSNLVFVFQTGNAIGGVSFGISKIEVTDTALPTAIACSFPSP